MASETRNPKPEIRMNDETRSGQRAMTKAQCPTNDQAPMTNAEAQTVLLWSLRFGHLLVIGH
jgi:hypothetical protein